MIVRITDLSSHCAYTRTTLLFVYIFDNNYQSRILQTYYLIHVSIFYINHFIDAY